MERFRDRQTGWIAEKSLGMKCFRLLNGYRHSTIDWVKAHKSPQWNEVMSVGF